MTHTPAPRCFGYIRVSDESQARDVVTSPDDQRKAIETLAAKLGVTVDAWFVDAGVSGATMKRRPAFMRLFAACRTAPRALRDPGYVLALNDSRFGRFDDPEEATARRWALKEMGWLVRYCENDDISDGTGRAFVRLASSAQASEYRRNIKANATRGARGSAERGYWTAAAPFGYRRMVVYPPERSRVLPNKVPKAKDEKVRLTPEPSEAAIVAELYQRYLEPGATLASVCAWITGQAPTRKWTVASVRWMLRNRSYLGHVEIGARMADPDDPGRMVRRHTAERWGSPDAHPAIVTAKMFDAVAAKLAANHAAPRRARSDYALSGVLRCSHCGSAYVGGGHKPDHLGRATYYYRCAGAIQREPICRGGNVARHLVDPLIVGTLAQMLSSGTVRQRITDALDRAMQSIEAGSSPSTAALVATEARAKEKQERVVRSIASGLLTDEEAASTLAQIRRELAGIADAKEHEKFTAARRATLADERGRLLTHLTNAPAALRAASVAELRTQIAYWCKSLTYDRARRVVRVELKLNGVETVLPESMDRLTSRNHPARPDVIARDVALPKRVRRAGGDR